MKPALGCELEDDGGDEGLGDARHAKAVTRMHPGARSKPSEACSRTNRPAGSADDRDRARHAGRNEAADEPLRRMALVGGGRAFHFGDPEQDDGNRREQDPGCGATGHVERVAAGFRLCLYEEGHIFGGAVATLRHLDLQGVLGFLRQAGAEKGPDPFPPQILGLLRTLVPSDAVSWHEWSVDGARSRYAVSSVDPDRTATVWEAYGAFRHQDPLPGGVPGAGGAPAIVGRTVKLSDILSDRDFRRLDLYHYVCRPLGVDHVMKLFLPTRNGVARSLVFDRGGRDFSERDRAVVDVLQPYLLQLEDNARARRFAATATTGDYAAPGLTPREREVLALVAEGKSNAEIAAELWIATGTVRVHLEHIYTKLDVKSRTAALARVRERSRPESGS
jgi:DNA-binding CsgD family transcriptional regulator